MARSMPTTTKRCAGTAARRRTHHSWKRTWRVTLPPVVIGDDDMGLDRGVGHRPQREAALRQTPPRREAGGHLAERGALAQPERTGHVGAQVAVAEPEPLWLHAVCRELALEQVALVGPAPASGPR